MPELPKTTVAGDNKTEQFVYKNNKFLSINLKNYISNKEVIICPYAGVEKPSLQYMNYLQDLLSVYKIDEIIILNSDNDKIFHETVYSYFPRLTTISDTAQNYINQLKNVKNKQESSKILCKKWIFQHLLFDGKEIGFWEQPISDHWKALGKNKSAMAKLVTLGPHITGIIGKMYKNRHLVNMWDFANFDTLATSDGYMLKRHAGAYIWYFNLFQNAELESMLRYK